MCFEIAQECIKTRDELKFWPIFLRLSPSAKFRPWSQTSCFVTSHAGLRSCISALKSTLFTVLQLWTSDILIKVIYVNKEILSQRIFTKQNTRWRKRRERNITRTKCSWWRGFLVPRHCGTTTFPWPPYAPPTSWPMIPTSQFHSFGIIKQISHIELTKAYKYDSTSLKDQDLPEDMTRDICFGRVVHPAAGLRT